MRAGVLRRGNVVVRDDVSEPVPGPGEILIRVEACGICGSDLHFVRHGAAMLDARSRVEGIAGGRRAQPDLDEDVFMGHEFCGRVLGLGPRTEGPTEGTLVTSVPVMVAASGMEDLAYSNTRPCGFSEQMLLSSALTLKVPNGLAPRLATLTEPIAVGLHAANKSGLTAGEGAIVMGCGPVGLAVIAALHLKGIAPIVASDLSAPRRKLAIALGADEVVDPRDESPFTAWSRVGGARPMASFEAVGVPGMLNEVMRVAPVHSRLVVVGMCVQPDVITPYFGIAKELNLQFVRAYEPSEFASSLHAIAEGHIDVSPLITGEVELANIPLAFDALSDPAEHCKILVVPNSGRPSS